MVILSLGLIRGALTGAIGGGLTAAILAAIRIGSGLPPFGDLVSFVSIIVGVLAFLFGLGAFGYWLRWAGGKVDDDEAHHEYPPAGPATSASTPATRSSASSMSSPPC